MPVLFSITSSSSEVNPAALQSSLSRVLGTLDFSGGNYDSTQMANTATSIPLPTRQELEILKILWHLKTATVRDVYEAFREQRRIAYTTVMTMLNIMERKGMVRKWQEGRAYVYKPTDTRERVSKKMVHEFVDRVFDGSPETLVLHLIDETDLSLEEQNKLKRMIQKSI